uniref:Uncharacterized protein n=1 Tax=Arundo donax TaxID=35708 RepID=A0A0A8YKG0_ARUDO
MMSSIRRIYQCDLRCAMSLWRRCLQLNHLCWNLLNIVVLLLLYHLWSWLWLPYLGLNLLTCLMWPLLLRLNVEL